MRFQSSRSTRANALGTWMVTHVDPSTEATRSFLAVAVTASKARSKVFLATGIPYDDLYASLVRRDDKSIDPRDWKPQFERFLGSLEEFLPAHTRACPRCDGRRLTSTPVPEHPATCSVCEGTGVRLRRRR